MYEYINGKYSMGEVRGRATRACIVNKTMYECLDEERECLVFEKKFRGGANEV